MNKILSLLLLICISINTGMPTTIPIRIDASNTYQTIDHFGASDCWSFQKIGAWDLENKARLADLLFSPTEGIGLSGWRFNIGAGINRRTIQHPWRTVETFEVSQDVYDWTRQAEERWFLHAAQERGVREFIAFVNSPPARMTRNGYTNCTENLGSTNLKPGFEGQFATYLVDILKFFRDQQGINFNHISPVNEPQWEWNNGSNQEGNRAGNADIITIVNALYDELKKQEVDTKISIVESGEIKAWHQLNSGMTSKYGAKYGDYLQELIDNPEISDKIGKHFGGHSYWSDRLNGQLVEHRLAARPFFTAYFEKGWAYWATEYCILDGPEGAGGHGRDLTIKSALDVARVIHFDLTHLDASAWNWWTAVSPEDYKDGLIYTNYKSNPTSQSIIESKILWALGNYSRYIRPGATRIKLTGANNKVGLMGSAFLNEAQDRMIIVFVNVANKDIQISMKLSGLEADERVAQFTPHITSNRWDDNLKEYTAVSIDSIYSVPARSVVTLVGEIDNVAGLKMGKTTCPKSIGLFQSYPNPFNNETKIQFELVEPAQIELGIYNSVGQKVKTLLTGFLPRGRHDVRWNGKNQQGVFINSGVYFCSLLADGVQSTIKLMMVE